MMPWHLRRHVADGGRLSDAYGGLGIRMHEGAHGIWPPSLHPWTGLIGILLPHLWPGAVDVKFDLSRLQIQRYHVY